MPKPASAAPAATVPPAPAAPAPAADSWGPKWAGALRERYASRVASVFILHGNVRDLVWSPDPKEGDRYVSLAEFLATKVLGDWDVVLGYDTARGFRPLAYGDPGRLLAMEQFLAPRLGAPETRVGDPDALLRRLDAVIDRNLIESDAKQRRTIGVLFDYADFLIPEGGPEDLSRGGSAQVVRFLNWARSPHIRQSNTVFVLIAESLASVNSRVVQSPHVAAIEIPMPDRAERRRFIEWVAREQPLEQISELKLDPLADLSNGLGLVNLQVILNEGKPRGEKVSIQRFRSLKRTQIERQCQGLVEFVEPDRNLDLLVGQQSVKDRLRQDAALLAQGHRAALPMGYLVTGAVGTGKTFLAECFAGDIGAPCVKLRNFRSKYVGETEGNLERVLTVLRSLGPVIVVIDEADAALGTRQASGDSGTSSRVFAMIAAQMGDTRYRGQILWMLLTSRPDFLPIDLKRQGRAEVHIPLFYPADRAEVEAMVEALAKKNKFQLDAGVHPPESAHRLSGSDIESLLLAAWRASLAEGRPTIGQQDVDRAWQDFVPSAQGLEKEAQELASVLECTQLSFLPERWRVQVASDEGRSRLQERLSALRRQLSD